ncbi:MULTISPECIES: hypothetical protein [Methanobacterium]|nr:MULTISPECIES: hypothetical protein [Methanobacterium]
MKGNPIQHEILELLYKQERRCSASVNKDFLIETRRKKSMPIN